MAKYWFDGESPQGMPEQVARFFGELKQKYHPEEKFLSGVALYLDSWNRGVIEIDDEEAARLQKICDEANEDWLWVRFGQASGGEHQVAHKMPGNGHYEMSWQQGGGA